MQMLKSFNHLSFKQAPFISSRHQSSNLSKALQRMNSQSARQFQTLMKTRKAEKTLYQNFLSKRGFSYGNRFMSGLDKFLNAIINRLPNRNIGFLLIYLNTFHMFIYWVWPRYSMHNFLNNFTFSKFNLAHGRLHTLLSCHFTHISFFAYLIDSVILYLFCQNLCLMHGSIYVAHLILLSMALGSLFLLLQHGSGKAYRPFCGNDAIIRGLLFTVIFKNPNATFLLIPIPVPIPAWIIAAIVLGIDYLAFNSSAYGGTTAAYLMINYLT